MPVYFAKFSNAPERADGRMRIWTGECSLRDWAEQETSPSECVVQTARLYTPDELFIDDDFVLRAHHDADDPDDPGMPVAVAQPLTVGWLLNVAAAVARIDHPQSGWVLQNLPGVSSRVEARELIAEAGLQLNWASLETGAA